MSERRAGPAQRWGSSGLALAAGVAAALAHPPWGILPGLLGYGLLLHGLERASPAAPLRSSFWRGWLAGCGYFTVGVWWIGEPFQVDAVHQGWMAPFAIVLVATGMALFWALPALLWRALAPRGSTGVVVFAGLFAAAEWLRGHVLTGFPWDLAGETWRAGSAMSQIASIVGAYGLTWITLATASAPALLIAGRRGLIPVGLALAALAALQAYGLTRLQGAREPGPSAPWVRIVQADVHQDSKYDPQAFRSIVERYVALTRRPAARTPDIVLWPEGAIPQALEDYLAPETWTRAAIIASLRPGQTLMLGGYRLANGDVDPPVIYNSLIALRPRGDSFALMGVYDKFRLVPFGEFLPFDRLAQRIGLKTLVHVGDGFTPGPRPGPLMIPGLPTVQPLICYESLFPGFTREGARAAGARPAWIANISNDAWFGATSGPKQHLNMASYRAIEEGLPMARATPTGVSAMIDAYGRIRPGARLDHGAYGVIDTPLPPALSPTLFARWGDLPFAFMLALSLFFVRPRSWSARRRHDH
jgi:apolipoprotein N-acyltransferase